MTDLIYGAGCVTRLVASSRNIVTDTERLLFTHTESKVCQSINVLHDSLYTDVYDVGIQRSFVRTLKFKYSCDKFYLQTNPLRLKTLIQAFYLMFGHDRPLVQMARPLVFECVIRSPLGAARLFFSII